MTMLEMSFNAVLTVYYNSVQNMLDWGKEADNKPRSETFYTEFPINTALNNSSKIINRQWNEPLSY